MAANEDFDLNKFVAELVQKNIGDLLKSVKNIGRSALKSVESNLRTSYNQYLLAAGNHYGSARTFFIREERKPLYNYYVPLEIRSGRSALQDVSIDRIASAGMNAIVAGKAGSGKSTLMRHLFLDSIRQRERIPVFAELNQLNDREISSIEKLIHNSFVKHGLKLDEDQILAALKTGGFCVLFDGLDEVDEDIRHETVKQIASFANQHPNNLTIVSSRPDDTYSALHSFNLFEVQPLSLAKAVALVNKLPFDEAIKAKFAKDLKATLYAKHTSFLSNPLLLSIMLLTYGQSASIPNRTCVFFNQAFEALFQTHDARKSGFARKRHTSLDILDFERAFAAFCLLTYDANAFMFSRTECLDYMKKSRALSEVEFEPAAFVGDCLQAVNLLMEDGLKLTFVHRAFQEYFTAKFVTKVDDAVKTKLLARLGAKSMADNVMKYFWELDQQSFEDLWLVPVIAKMRESLGTKRKITKRQYVRHLKELYESFQLGGGDDGSMTWSIGFTRTSPELSELRNAIWIVFHRYWKKGVATSVQSNGDPFYVKLSSLSASDDDLQAIAEADSPLSLAFLQFFVDLPRGFEAQRKSRAESLSSILGI